MRWKTNSLYPLSGWLRLLGCDCPENLAGRRTGRPRLQPAEAVVRHQQQALLLSTHQTSISMNRHISKKAPNGSKLKNPSEYQSWRGMLERCTNKNHSTFHLYGGAGITVCDRWRSFEDFLEDMGHRPAGTSLDRIDGKLGYSPSNCRWANRVEQFENSSRYTPVAVGTRFGMLTVISPERILVSHGRSKKSAVRCMCECGRGVVVRVNALRTGGSTSCGCKRVISLIIRNKTK